MTDLRKAFFPKLQRVLLVGLCISLLLVSGCTKNSKTDPEDAILPSSFFDDFPNGEQLEAFRRHVQEKAASGEPLAPSFKHNSRSETMLAALELKPTDVVADVGAGTGPFQVFMLEQDAPFQTMYAVDINGRALEFLLFILNTMNYPDREKVRIVTNRFDDVMLPADSIDVLWLLNTPAVAVPAVAPDGRPIYQHDEQKNCILSITKALKPGGRVHVFESQDTHGDSDMFPFINFAFTNAGLHPVRQELIDLQPDGAPHYHLVFEKPK